MRLSQLLTFLQAGASTAVMATTFVSTAPPARANTTSPVPSIAERVERVRAQSPVLGIDASLANAPTQLAWWRNWGNGGYHPWWHNWPNWHNWHNWGNGPGYGCG